MENKNIKLIKELKHIISKMSADGLEDGLEWEYDSVYVTRDEWEETALNDILRVIEAAQKQ